MEGKIQKMEGDILRAIQGEWKETVESMLLKQHKRNRSIVKAIIDTCSDFRTSIKDEFITLRGEEDE